MVTSDDFFVSLHAGPNLDITYAASEEHNTY